MKPLTRRALFAAAGSSVALPWLEALAQNTRAPQRLIIMYTPNGFLRDRWITSTTATPGLALLGSTLDPVLRHRPYLVMVDGLENRAASEGAGPVADRSMATLLTGTDLANGATTGFPSGGGISLDQQVGALSTRQMLLPPLVLGLGTAGVRTTLATPSYAASRMPVVPVTDLTDTMAKLFPPGMTGTPTTDPAQRRALVRLSLDSTMRNLNVLRARMSGHDAVRLDVHTSSIRELMLAVERTGAQCAGVPTLPAPGLDPQRILDAGRIAMDLVVAAFACDRARVATLVYEGAGGNAVIGGAGRGHNDLALAAPTSAAAAATLAGVERQFMEEFGYLLDKLGARPEAGGTLLDSTLVLCCSDVSSANPISWRNLPCLLAGRAGGALTTNRLVRATGAPWNQLLSSIAAMFGAGTQVGNPKYGAGSLPGL